MPNRIGVGSIPYNRHSLSYINITRRKDYEREMEFGHLVGGFHCWLLFDWLQAAR